MDVIVRHSIKNDFYKELEIRYKLYDLNYKKFLPSQKNAPILDLGCGPGYFLKYLKDLGYENIQGVDISTQQIEVARSFGVDSYIFESDFFNFLRSTDKRFDMICAFHVLEHLFKREILDLLDLIYERLNPKGMLLVEVPNTGSPILGSQGRYSDFTHETGFTPQSLKEVLLLCGFSNVEAFPKKGSSPFARIFFKICNYFFHSRFNRDLLIEGEIFGIGYKKD